MVCAMASGMFFWVTRLCATALDDSAAVATMAAIVFDTDDMGIPPLRVTSGDSKEHKKHVSGYFLSLYPVLNIHQTVTRHAPRNNNVIPTLTLWLTSEISKKLQRNPLIR
jgi:hypothetical protein